MRTLAFLDLQHDANLSGLTSFLRFENWNILKIFKSLYPPIPGLTSPALYIRMNTLVLPPIPVHLLPCLQKYRLISLNIAMVFFSVGSPFALQWRLPTDQPHLTFLAPSYSNNTPPTVSAAVPSCTHAIAENSAITLLTRIIVWNA